MVTPAQKTPILARDAGRRESISTVATNIGKFVARSVVNKSCSNPSAGATDIYIIVEPEGYTGDGSIPVNGGILIEALKYDAEYLGYVNAGQAVISKGDDVEVTATGSLAKSTTPANRIGIAAETLDNSTSGVPKFIPFIARR